MEGEKKISKKSGQWAYIKRGFVCAVPRGGEGHEKIILLCPPSLIPPQIPFGPKMGFNTLLYSIKVATRAPKSRGSCRDVVVAARAGLGPSVAAFVGV